MAQPILSVHIKFQGKRRSTQESDGDLKFGGFAFGVKDTRRRQPLNSAHFGENRVIGHYRRAHPSFFKSRIKCLLRQILAESRKRPGSKLELEGSLDHAISDRRNGENPYLGPSVFGILSSALAWVDTCW